MTVVFDAADLDIFFSDFTTEVAATTWGATVSAVFDEDYVDFEEVSTVTPYLLMRESDVDAGAAEGDLFTVSGVAYKLVDIEQEDPSVSKVILARA